MSDLHIDDFYKDCAKTLVFLYGHFPTKVTVYVEDISGPDTPDEFGLHSPRHQACFNTLLWLAQTGYIYFDQTIRQEAIDQVVLSHQAFLSVSASIGASQEYTDPASPTQAYTFVDALRRELKEGTSFSLADTVQQLMRYHAKATVPTR